MPYREIAVEVSADVRLAGTLTVPEGSGPFPATVLITGGGSHDRDETLADHKPFQVLADALARAGVAVLRVDDRGVGGSAGDRGTADYDELSEDILACVRFVAQRPEIESRRVGLLGHSEGGYLAPLAIQRGEPGLVAALVLLASPAVPGPAVLKSQIEAVLSAQRVARSQIVTQLEHIDALTGRLAADDLGGAVALSEQLLSEQTPPGTNDEALRTQARATVRALEPLLAHDPGPTLQALNIPTLAIYGSRDLQVLAEQNEPAMRAALADRSATMVTTLPGLNHLMQPCSIGTPDEYAQIETTIAADALELITTWLGSHLGVSGDEQGSTS